MKVKRQKRVRKILSFYAANFKITSPYNVLVDGTFCKAALTFQLNISEQLPKYLDAEVKLFTSACVIAECEALGSILYGPLKILQQYDIAECKHKPAIAASECLRRIAYKERKNKKFIIATQDTELSDKVRKKAGIPLLFSSHNTIVLEAPSENDKKKASTSVQDKMKQEHEKLTDMKRHVLGEETDKVKKKRKKKGVNPLSCKKKAKKIDGAVQEGRVNKRKRKRHKRIHIPDHVKQHLK